MRLIAQLASLITETAADGTGRLRVRGANQCLGYFKRPDMYAAALDARAGSTPGILCGPDGRGGIRIVRRLKDVIVRNGHKVPVVEVESVLHAHPKVAAVALVTDPDDCSGSASAPWWLPGIPLPG